MRQSTTSDGAGGGGVRVATSRLASHAGWTESGSVFLNLVRGAGALAVLLLHTWLLFSASEPGRTQFSLFERFFLTVSSHGRDAVIVFFIVSGIVIAKAAMDAGVRGAGGWGQYALARTTRLYVVLLPSLFLTMFWDRLSGSTHLAQDFAAHSNSPAAFIGSLAFCQYIFMPVFGSNGPTWSLAFEGWLYLFFPLCLIAAGLSKSRSAIRLACAGVAVAIFVLLGPVFRGMLVIWMFGGGVAFLPRMQNPTRWAWPLIVLSVLFFWFSMRWIRAHPLPDSSPGSLADVEVALCFLPFVVVATKTQLALPNWLAKFAAGWAGFSYTTYLVHAPFLIFLVDTIEHGRNRWRMSDTHALEALGIVAIVLAYSYLVSLATEAQTGRIRKALAALTRTGYGRMRLRPAGAA